MMDVPSFWSVGLLWLGESNRNGIANTNVNFDATYRIATAWGIPVPSIGADVRCRPTSSRREDRGEFQFESRVGNSLMGRELVGVVRAITPWNYPLLQRT
jgi:hypothetical protein